MADRLFRRPGSKAWYTIVRDPLGKWVKVSTRCTDRKAAEAVDRRLQREMADPSAAAEASATLGGILADYLDSRVARGRAAASIEHVKQKSVALRTHLPERLMVLDHAACEAYIVARRKPWVHAKTGHRYRGAALTTIKKELRVLKAALVLARRNGKFSRDPDTVIPELEETYQPRKRALTMDELLRLRDALPVPRAAHVLFIVALGARWSESVRARRSDVSATLVHLRGSKTAASKRDVPVLGLTRPLLVWSLERAGKDLLFERWTNVRRALILACGKAGLDPVTPNDLRRTFAKLLRVAGASPADIGTAMGHTTAAMVEKVYGRVDAEELGKMLERSTGWETSGPAVRPEEPPTDTERPTE